MTQDLVQIGRWLISKSLLDAALPLLGVLIGGLITYWSTIALEKRRWEKEAREKKKEQRRKALELALEWIDPIRNALTKAELMVTSFKQGHMDEEHFVQNYPNVLSSLVERDLPRHLIVFLSWDVYRRGRQLVDKFEELYRMALIGKGQDGLWECWELSAELSKEVESLESHLEEEYKKTFD